MTTWPWPPEKTAIIIGAGPAGLTAAYELLTRTDLKPLVLERDEVIGGLARTENYKGNRTDIGGHRFFSKSDRVMNWWFDMLPLQKLDGGSATITYERRHRTIGQGASRVDPDEVEQVMLVRPRRSRIYYLRRLFDYPISLSGDTLAKLGWRRAGRIGLSYLAARIKPIRPERSLEEFLVNRFGRELYRTFFKSYTEKVWGVPCDRIGAAWGAQRIKGLSIGKAVGHALRRLVRAESDVAHKRHETSLIEQFLYPKYGPGQMWQTCADRIRALGGEIVRNAEVDRLYVDGNRLTGVRARDARSGPSIRLAGAYVFSTMAIRDLVEALETQVPASVKEIGRGLVYRDFIVVGLLVKALKVREPGRSLIRDNWIYIQEPDVRLGRLQIFNNWSPYMVADPSRVWLGLEYFCNEGDDLWSLSDADLAAFATRELASIDVIDEVDALDATVIRMPKAYPAYFGSYDRFPELRGYLDGFENLFLVGRNGMHRYNNQDHSMLAAMTAVDNIVEGRQDKANIWDVNTEDEYHEEGPEPPQGGGASTP